MYNKIERMRLELLSYIEWKMRHETKEFQQIKETLLSLDFIDLNIWAFKNDFIDEDAYNRNTHICIIEKNKKAYQELAK